MDGSSNRQRVELRLPFEQALVIQVPANATGFQRSSRVRQWFFCRVGDTHKPREAFEGTYNQALIGSSDPNFYFVLGVSLKF